MQVLMRRMPRPVLPSGELKLGTDFKIAQVAVGLHLSDCALGDLGNQYTAQ